MGRASSHVVIVSALTAASAACSSSSGAPTSSDAGFDSSADALFDTGSEDAPLPVDSPSGDAPGLSDGGASNDAPADSPSDVQGAVETGISDAPPESAADGPACVAKPAGLVDWWRGENDATDSVGTANGAWSGTAAYAAGEVGQAFSFSSGSYVRAPVTYSGAFTIDLWVETANASQGTYSAVLASSDASSDPYFQIDMDGAGNYRVQAGNDALHVPFGAASTTQFENLAMTYDGNQTITTYLNGAMASTGTYTGGTLTFTTVKIGLNRTSNDPFDGVVDEVQLYDVVLSAAEIQTIYAAGANGVCP